MRAGDVVRYLFGARWYMDSVNKYLYLEGLEIFMRHPATLVRPGEKETNILARKSKQ